MKTFIINWHPNEKYGAVINRNSIQLISFRKLMVMVFQ